uniref:2Fe-2S ferredoxin-type domain-containing protein n=1 Tax=Eutreptiella gymnastica TaxID=73025 RepID=A0A7S4GIP2_9EUGL
MGASFLIAAVTTYLMAPASGTQDLWQMQAVQVRPQQMVRTGPAMQARPVAQINAAAPRSFADVAPQEAYPREDIAGELLPIQQPAGPAWVASIVGLGSVMAVALVAMWSRLSAKEQPSAHNMVQMGSIWAMAAAEDLDFPGPGNPEDEFEMQVVWEGEEKTVKIKGDQSMLMACEEAGMEIPYLCRNGVCLTCTGRVDDGTENVRKDSQCQNEDNLAAGYICTCSTYVGGPGVKVTMGVQEEAYKKQFGRFEQEEREREEARKKKVFGLF